MSKMISLTEDGRMMSSEDLTAVDFVNITLSTQMQIFKSIVNQANDAEEAEAIVEDLYDLYNQAASAFLTAFAPEIELRPDLTAEAILKAENEILDQVE